MFNFRDLSPALRIRTTYIGALAFIGILLIINFVVVSQFAVIENSINTTKTMLFDQRYRLQRIALLSNLLESGTHMDELFHDEISALLEQMESDHRQFLVTAAPETHPILYERPFELNEGLYAFIETAQDFNLHRFTPTDIESFTYMTPVITDGVNALLHLYQLKDSEHTRMVTLWGGVSFAFILLTLVVLVVYVFLPMERGIAQQQQKLLNEINERQRAEQKLRDSEERLQTVTRNFPNGLIIMVDRDLRYVMADGLGLSVFGMSREKLEGKSISETYPPEQAAQVTQLYRRTLAGEQLAGEMLYNGNRWFSYRTQPIYDADGEIVAALNVSQDITAQKQMETAVIEQERLQMALEKEYEFDQLKTKIMTSISHEFRTPLAVIQSSSELLQHYSNRMDVSRRDDHFRAIGSSIERITAMLDAISAILKNQFTEHPPTLIKVDVQRVVEQVTVDYERKHPLYQFVVTGDTCRVLSNRGMLEHVLNMLVLNAVKYSRPGAVVTIDLSSTPYESVIKVQDEGIGISEADLARIFDPFYRGSNVGNVPGIGLGLYIVKDFVKILGGKVTVESQLGRGTTFTVTLPCTV